MQTKQEIKIIRAYYCSYKVKQDKMFDLRWSCCTFCLDNRLFWPRVWLLDVLDTKKVTTLFFVWGKKPFAFLLSGLGDVKAMRNKHEADSGFTRMPPRLYRLFFPLSTLLLSSMDQINRQDPDRLGTESQGPPQHLFLSSYFSSNLPTTAKDTHSLRDLNWKDRSWIPRFFHIPTQQSWYRSGISLIPDVSPPWPPCFPFLWWSQLRNKLTSGEGSQKPLQWLLSQGSQSVCLTGGRQTEVTSPVTRGGRTQPSPPHTHFMIKIEHNFITMISIQTPERCSLQGSTHGPGQTEI